MATNKNIQKEQTTNTDVSSNAYQQLVADMTARVQAGQLTAFRAVNKELIQVYWDLGKMIINKQQEQGWGNSVVEFLAKDLQKAFLGMEGLSSRNLWRMRIFYLAYSEFLPPAMAEIGWTHNYVIIEKCKDPNERLFYIHQTKNNGWTKNVLIHQIENQTYEKTLISQHNFKSRCF